MSAREWKRGDVAMVRTAHGEWVQSWAERKHPGAGPLVFAHEGGGYVTVGCLDPARVRPLVVIDPEDREQVERLAEAYCATLPPNPFTKVDLADRLRDALREFADPTPPCGARLSITYSDGKGHDQVCERATGHEGPHADGPTTWTAAS